MQPRIEDVNIGLYPAGKTVLDYLSHQYDALNASTYMFWYDRSPIVALARAYQRGECTRRSAEKILRSYEDGEYSAFSLDEILSLADLGVFSDCDDWLVFSDNFQELILEDWANDATSNLFLPGSRSITFLAFFQPSKHLVVVTKSPWVETRAQEPPWDESQELPRYSDAMVPGHALTFVLPGEIEAAIKQEKERGETW